MCLSLARVTVIGTRDYLNQKSYYADLFVCTGTAIVFVKYLPYENKGVCSVMHGLSVEYMFCGMHECKLIRMM